MAVAAVAADGFAPAAVARDRHRASDWRPQAELLCGPRDVDQRLEQPERTLPWRYPPDAAARVARVPCTRTALITYPWLTHALTHSIDRARAVRLPCR